jgi:hypothetical protein
MAIIFVLVALQVLEQAGLDHDKTDRKLSMEVEGFRLPSWVHNSHT